jgi:hypothetical protein
MTRKTSKTAAAGAGVVAAAAALSLGLGTAAGAGVVSPAATPPWTSVGRAGVSGAVTALTAAQVGNANTQWAFVTTANEVADGYPSVYTRVNNGSWARADLPGSKPGEAFVAAAAISPGDVLGFTQLPGAGGREWRWNGRTWSVIKTFDAQIGDASVVDADDVWVSGDDTRTGGDLGVYHYNGETWTKVSSTLLGALGTGGDGAWAYTGTTVATYNGKKWTGTNLAKLIPGSDPRIADVKGSDGAWYAIAEGDGGDLAEVLIYNGHTWANAGQVGGASAVPNKISTDGDGGIWFPVTLEGATDKGDSAVLHYTRSVKELTETDLPGTIESITALDNTHELAGGYTVNSKGSPATFAEIEFYN